MTVLSTKIIPITPKELYLRRVSSIYDRIRAENAGLEFIPADFGGLLSQREVLQEVVALEVTDLKGEVDG